MYDVRILSLSTCKYTRVHYLPRNLTILFALYRCKQGELSTEDAEEVHNKAIGDMRILLQKQLSTALLRLVDELSMVYAGSHHTHGTGHGSGQGKSDMISPVSVAVTQYDSNSVFPFQAGMYV